MCCVSIICFSTYGLILFHTLVCPENKWVLWSNMCVSTYDVICFHTSVCPGNIWFVFKHSFFNVWCDLFDQSLCFALCGGLGRGRATPTRQANQTTTHITHYVCTVLWFVLRGGSGRASATRQAKQTTPHITTYMCSVSSLILFCVTGRGRATPTRQTKQTKQFKVRS